MIQPNQVYLKELSTSCEPQLIHSSIQEHIARAEFSVHDVRA
ncbi:uncharacterized protein RCC_01711 [Ramularia collo-cygni]|uniref:Uncharacterized protein n=1 Tax=Ramularia collo-cygni TaxID=112498 RepID=A0A2D3V6D6_9PEZI|nr:uncharacterized protein RCC_01711 [Ramularia collo-cygni]CZT15873.1 uncharacterized protein RCC_01711 [Ramularia collo-cygni]